MLTPVALGYLLWLGWQGGAIFRSGDPGLMLMEGSWVAISVGGIAWAALRRRRS